MYILEFLLYVLTYLFLGSFWTLITIDHWFNNENYNPIFTVFVNIILWPFCLIYSLIKM